MADPFEQLWGPSRAASAGPLTLNLIKGFEGFAPVAKWDVRQHSGGYGSRARPGERFTPETAEQRLRENVRPIGAWIDRNVTVPLTPERRAALSSFAYNLGEDDLGKLLPDINRGDWQTVGNRMLSFNKARNERTGQLEPLEGLTTRRRKEAELVMGGALPETKAMANDPFEQLWGPQMRQAPTGGAGQPMPAGGMGGLGFGGGDEPNYFSRVMQDPMFLMGASVLGGGLAGQDFGTAAARGAQAAQSMGEMHEKRRKAAAWSRLFAGGQPNMQSPLLKNLPAEVVPLIQQMGPEEGMDTLVKLAFKRMAPADLQKVGPGETLYDPREGREVYRGPSAAEKAPSGYRYAAGGGELEAIPGGPATVIPGEQAGRLALMQQAQGDLAGAKKLLGPDMSRTAKLFNYGETGGAERTIKTAIEATLRALTGAAAPESEVDRYVEMFGPTIWDSAATRTDKMRRLEEFLSRAESSMLKGRGGPAASQHFKTAPGAGAQPGASANKATKDMSVDELWGVLGGR